MDEKSLKFVPRKNSSESKIYGSGSHFLYSSLADSEIFYFQNGQDIANVLFTRNFAWKFYLFYGK